MHLLSSPVFSFIQGVLYDSSLLRPLATALRTGHVNALDRIGLLLDAMAFAKQGWVTQKHPQNQQNMPNFTRFYKNVEMLLVVVMPVLSS